MKPARHFSNILARLRRWLVILGGSWVFEASALDGQVPFSQYGYDRWQSPEGLPNNNVVSIAQTSDGYLRIGTLEGLTRFNGVAFARSSEEGGDSLATHSILSLLATPDGQLWIGTEAGLMRWQKPHFYAAAFSARGQLFGFPMVTDKAGVLWIGGRGLLRWEAGIATRVPVPFLSESSRE